MLLKLLLLLLLQLLLESLLGKCFLLKGGLVLKLLVSGEGTLWACKVLQIGL